MNDELQQSIGILLKAISFYICVLAFKEFMQFIFSLDQRPEQVPLARGPSASQRQPRDS